MRAFIIATRDAALVVALSALVALAFNGLRADRLPLVAAEPYEILVPCPELRADADAVAPTDPIVTAERTLLVDAREPDAFARWHAPGARSVVFDYLDAVSEADVRAIVQSRAAAVVVYGDPGPPDSGEELARELAGRGVVNVSYVTGGAPALRAALEGAP